MSSSITLDPLALAALLACACAIGALLAGPSAQLVRRLRDRAIQSAAERAPNALIMHLRRSQAFAAHKDQTAQRRVSPAGGDVMLRADVESLASIQRIWGEAARQGALSQVAGILRRGVRSRRAERLAAGDTVRVIPGEGFVIILRAPGDGAAAGIAQRLRAMLARTPIEGLGADIRLNASFGIAERGPGERYAAWRRRADKALGAAKARGEGEIMEAELTAEPLMLPAPAPPSAPGIDRAAASAA